MNESNHVQVDFGHYITQEYSILKSIFSHLTAKELQVCARVCREWKKMADKFVQYSVECYHAREDDEWQEFNRRINPSLVFYFDKMYSCRVDALHEKVSKLYDVVGVPFLGLLAAHPIYTPCSKGTLSLNCQEEGNCGKGRTLVFFPQIPGLTVRKYEFDKRVAVKPEDVEPLLSAKGVLLLSESSSSCVTASNRVVHYLYFTKSKKKEVRSERPCLAGGLLAKCCQLDSEGALIASPVIAVTLEGENVTIHCDINKTYDYRPFFKRLSESAGPSPPGAVRFAFVFNCVGRLDDSAENHNEELAIFREYFPGVPYFGYWSYGEFCIPDSHARNMTDPKKIRIDRHIRYLNSASASYMIVTVQHPE